MPSSHFTNLEESVKALKNAYLGNGAFPNMPSQEDQERTRGFIMLFHAELEEYIEESLKELAISAFNGVTSGNFSRVAISLLLFCGLPAQTGGARLRMPTTGGGENTGGTKKEKMPRLLATRYGEAHGKYIAMVKSNNGAREKYLAALGVPLGLDAQKIDSSWINELESICSYRGKFAHMSRKNSLIKVEEINPSNIWESCKRIVWGVTGMPESELISSFQEFDEWIENEKILIGSALVSEPKWRFKFFHAIAMMWDYWHSRKEIRSIDDD